jgi:Holliday junction resolvase-like predicted endonuclease
MPIASRLFFQAVHWDARKGLRDGVDPSPAVKKLAPCRTAIRGETYAYWYLPRHGYVFEARNFAARGSQGEIDQACYGGKALAFVEAERRVRECSCRYDVVAIDDVPGKPPVVRLHKDAFRPQM